MEMVARASARSPSSSPDKGLANPVWMSAPSDGTFKIKDNMSQPTKIAYSGRF
jgi:hypothetical protein